MPTLGVHLLGRKKPEPDPRDYPLSDYLDADIDVSGDDLARALSALEASKTAAKVTKTFAKAATAHIRVLEKVVPIPTPVPASGVVWSDDDTVLDQGDTPHCVGFGNAQFGNTDPVNDKFTNADGDAIYYEAKVIDGEPKQEDGSSVHSGIKALKNRGRVGTYAWSTSLAEIKQWVLTSGPMVIGTDWYNDMFNPDANGFVTPTGGVAGGHCYVIVGWDENDDVTFLNSWDATWGLGGRFKMKASDFNVLVTADGFEGCAVVELPLPASEVNED